ncbi:MAG: type II toxin-antitoxin system HicA family toxin [Mycobacteriales bacterium]
MPSPFPALTPRKLERAIESLGYRCVRQEGSHKVFKAPGRRNLVLSISRELSANEVKNFLVRQAGLTLEEALEVALSV